MQSLTALLGIKGFIPHGYCLLWSPVLLGLHVISDLLITLAYYSIPVMLVYFIRQRKDFPYPWLLILFAGFIVACGTTHLLSAITVWIPLYWLEGLLKALTAIISLVTAVLMLWVIPRILSLPSSAQLQIEIQQRKVIEVARQKTFDKLQKIANRVPGLVYQYRLRPDGGSCFPYASTAIHDIYRVSPEDVREDAFQVLAILHPEDYDGIIASIQTSARDLTPWNYEYRVKFDDSTVRWLLGNALPEREADGSTLWHGFITDITGRKLMEKKLSDSDAFNVSILDSLTSHIAVLDTQGVIVAVNNAWRQFGKENGLLESSIGANYLDACDHENAVESGIAAVLAGRRESFQLEYPCHSPDRQRWFHMKVSPLQGSCDGAVVSHEDITERKQTEAKLDAIFNASVEGIISYDLSGVIVSANAALATIFGYQPEELVGCSINKLMLSSGKDIFPMAKNVAGRIQEIEGRHKNGSIVPLDLSIAEYVIDNTRYFTNIVRDVSLRKSRERRDKEHLDQLAHVTRLGLMGEMASGIAHEVNQPLAAISSYTQVSINLINIENPDLVKLAEILSKTQQQALRAGRIIHRMRAFVKSHAKQHSITDVNTLVHNCVGLCAAELKQNGIKLSVELADNLPPIYVDQIQIEQVIINLIRNSADALQSLPEKQQRRISIRSCVTDNNSVQVRVTDNGPGLAEELQQKILMPFYTTKADGMGMGLSISRSLIEAHEGSLHFTSEPGKGSAFYFELPVQRKSEAPV